MISQYIFTASEKKWQQFWDKNAVYKWNSASTRANMFVIDTPPPTVSGMLHMGHVFSYTNTDFIARYHRMRGKSVFFPIGFDDNGLPTERLVEKIKGVRAANMNRSDFVALCRDVIYESENIFRQLFKSIAFSYDWNLEYQTISPHSITISQLSFIDLYRKNLVELRDAPVFWDPVDKTALSQIEIEDKEKLGTMSTIAFDVESLQYNRDNVIHIATTRPEMLPSCVAILFHPDDVRYKHLINIKAIVPIFGQTVPCIADFDVNPEKGTGLVMCCTFGDIQDVVWWRRHNFPLVSCIDYDGKMINAGPLSGMYVSAARTYMLNVLMEDKRIKEQQNIVQFVKCAERSGALLEIITSKQWYIHTLKYKRELLEKAKECKWYPENMKVRLDNWICGLTQDWCISRQRYSGVPFPVWYSLRDSERGNVIIADIAQLPVDPLIDLPYGYERHEVIADHDVMDTWATSAVSPQISSHGIAHGYALDEQRHKLLFPFDLRAQGHDIIRSWAFGTIVKALHHENVIPWRNIMISGWCLAEDKSKMSKSKGNVVTPDVLIKNYSADVVRYWASTIKLGADVVYSEKLLHGGKRLINKLWNAGNFCIMHISKAYKSAIDLSQSEDDMFILDKWVISKLCRVILRVEQSFEAFDYFDARCAIEEFFWNIFCDNYLELIKIRLYACDSIINECVDANVLNGWISAVITIKICITVIIHLFAPFIPHITEEIAYKLHGLLYKECDEAINTYVSIHRQGGWDDILDDKIKIDDFADIVGDHVIELIGLVRKYKTQNNMALNAPLNKLTLVIRDINATLPLSVIDDIRNTTHALNVSFVTDKNIKCDQTSMMLESECKKYCVIIN